MIQLESIQVTLPLPDSTRRSFREWRSHLADQHVLPIIGVTGSRGKTTVVQLLDAIFTEAGLRTATRTDAFVEIRGKRQRGELAPWRNARDELMRGTLDIAIEELDWVTIQSMGLKPESYPLFAVTNICGNRDACLIQSDARRAAAALPMVFEATTRDGALVLTGDEIIVAIEGSAHERAATYVGISRESPGLRGNLEAGRSSAWVERDTLYVGDAVSALPICSASELGFALSGRAGFQLHNALIASAVATRVGIAPEDIRRALARFAFDPKRMPTTFQMLELDGRTVVLDRPNPSWFLRSVLRALRDLGPARIITIVGRLDHVPGADLHEIGRLLGRASSVFVTHSQEEAPEVAEAIRSGAALNDVPPMIVHVKSENRAISRALAMARRGDLVFVLTYHQEALTRQLHRRRIAPPSAQASLVFV